MGSVSALSPVAGRKRRRNCIPIEPTYVALGMDHIPPAALALPAPTICIHCRATKFAHERPTFCCHNGQVQVATNETPKELVALFTGDDDCSENFHKYARLYNSFFAFSSLGGKLTKAKAKGIYTLSLHGQIYHYISDLLPDGDDPKFLQRYFYNGAAELDQRIGCFDKLRPDILSTLMTVMNQNPYAFFFRSLREVAVPDDLKILIYRNPVVDQRVHNAPTSDAVATVFVEDANCQQVHSHHILVHGRSNGSHRVRHYYGCYDPLQYPLLCPKGESGWHQGLKRVGCRQKNHLHANITNDLFLREEAASKKRAPKEDKDISCREYYAYKLQIRPNNFLLNSGRIFLQYIVDMYVKIENTRLDFLRTNQKKIRSELYQGIVDSVNDGITSAASIGRRVILPSSFMGGPRDKRLRCLNAMAIVYRYGRPDLFITITCNPNWPEIKEQLQPRERIENRPDLVARVFRAKLILLKKLIKDKHIFGPVAAMIEVIEFQKRGLPHAHILLILARKKMWKPADFNDYVCAELPLKEQPYLRSLVIQHMLHGPCGTLNPKCSCMKDQSFDDKCRFNYPKEYAEFTTWDDEPCPLYRRRKNGNSVVVRGVELDNRWVIPYNPYLLAALDCHVNVEICSTTQAVKYLYKQIYRGHDRACFDISGGDDETEDEITAFQSARWISPPESAWRIFGFELYDMSPAVIPLQIHLPKMQFVTFSEFESLQNTVADEDKQTTMLTEFFKTNYDNPDEGPYLYIEFPEHYVWHKSAKRWSKRQTTVPVIGRLSFVNPSEGERYYLRVLLANVKSPKSFTDLRTVEGHIYATFQEAAEKYGLIEQSDYVDSCIEEATKFQMPGTLLRRLFATLLVYFDHVNPLSLWQRFYKDISQDFAHRYKSETAKILQLTCVEVEKYLESMGKSMKFFKLEFFHELETISRDISDALYAPVPAEYVDASKRLNLEQRAAYDCIMHHVIANKPGAFFVEGPGGTGKTFLYCALYAETRALGKIVLPTATSGIAASNMPTGRTAHSQFKIPMDDIGSLMCNVSKQSSLAHLLREASLIIWDEASMARKEGIEALNLLLQDICDKEDLFGGKVIVFGGDFRQVLPVLPRKKQDQVLDASLLSSYLWPKLVKFTLSQNIRASEDPLFSQFLLELGNGALQEEEKAYIEVPTEMIDCFNNIDDNFCDLSISLIFPELNSCSLSNTTFCNRAILTPTNEDVDLINAALIERFPGEPVTYKSIDSIIGDGCNLYPTEFLNTLCPPGMSPHNLVLKEDCPVMLLRNLDPSGGLCNGTRLICKQLHQNVILGEISSGYYKGEKVLLPRIHLRPSPSTEYPFHFQRKQFPIKLCFAMTINKAQGQTLDQVGLYLRQPCFAHGQFYVGCSRAKRRTDLKVFTKANVQASDSKQRVENVVSFEILKRAKII